MSSAESEPLLDFESAAYLSDPYACFRRLRETDPVHRAPWGDWYLTRYHDVARALSDRAFRREPPREAWPMTADARAETAFDRMSLLWVIYRDPPDHTRLRRAMSRPFMPRAVDALRPRIEGIVDALLDDLAGARTSDLIAGLAFPLPVIVISELLGVPAEDRDTFRAWAAAICAAVDRGRADDLARAEPAVRDMAAYFRDLGRERRRRPKDDLLSALAAETSGDRALGEQEFEANCAFLLWSGHETTKSLIGNAVLALLQRPDQWGLLCAQPDLVDGAVDEVLRFESPVQKMCRWTTEPIGMGDRTIPGGQLVVSLLGAANRDPAAYPDPDRLDITRSGPGHVAFGLGLHHCLGARLARLEAGTALAAMARRMPHMSLASPHPEWLRNTSLRVLERLVVAH